MGGYDRRLRGETPDAMLIYEAVRHYDTAFARDGPQSAPSWSAPSWWQARHDQEQSVLRLRVALVRRVRAVRRGPLCLAAHAAHAAHDG